MSVSHWKRGGVVLLGVLLALGLLGCPCPWVNRDLPDGVWVVDQSNTSGVEDGLTWATAFTTIQAGIDAAATAGGGEVWVAEGAYDEQRVSEVNVAEPFAEPMLVDTGSLQLAAAVGVYGGFGGWETRLNRRDWEDNEVIIDGAQARAGQPAYHVVIAEDGSVLDGVTVRGGRADGDTNAIQVGGGLVGSDLRVRHCRFVDNSARDVGGAAYLLNPEKDMHLPVVFTDCTFSDNLSERDGGALGLDGGYGVSGCLFEGNTAEFGGGAVWSNYVVLDDCVFSSNTASMGGAVYGAGDATDCAFYDNAASAGGAVYASSRFMASRCWFEGNSAGTGGALYMFIGLGVTPSLNLAAVNSVFYGNHASARGGAMAAQGVLAGEDLNYSAAAFLESCTLVGNVADTEAGALYCLDATGTVRNSILWDNGDNPLVAANVNPPQGNPPPYSPAWIAATYSDIEGGFPGEGNLNADPQFVNPATQDFHLQPGSPGINAGTDAFAPEEDYDGIPRPQGEGYDMGAFEADANS